MFMPCMTCVLSVVKSFQIFCERNIIEIILISDLLQSVTVKIDKNNPVSHNKFCEKSAPILMLWHDIVLFQMSQALRRQQ